MLPHRVLRGDGGGRSVAPRLPFELAFADLAGTPDGEPDPAVFRARQIDGLTRMMPIILAGNLLAFLLFAIAQHGRYATGLVASWLAPMLALVCFAGVRWWRRHHETPETVATSTVRWVELFAALFGLGWALFPAMFANGAGADMTLLVFALAIAAAGAGALSLRALPSAAIIYALIVTGSLMMTGILVGAGTGLALGGLMLAYGVILIAMILSAHRQMIGESRDARLLGEQRETISLLLHDFEQGASDWLWQTGADGRIAYCSARLADVTGMSLERLTGATLRQAAAATEDAEGWSEVAALMAERQPVNDVAVAVNRPQPGVTWQLTARALRGRDGGFLGYRGVGRDITVQRAAQNELVRAKIAAERASEAKSQFLAVISHELNTPLNAIVGFAGLLAQPDARDLSIERQAEYAGMVLDSGRQLRDLIGDVLDISRIERGDLALVEHEAEAAEIAEVAVRQCRDAAERADIAVIATLTDNLEITGDIGRIRQVMVNLIANAIKFSMRGGTVAIGLDPLLGGGAVFSVRDGGIGIPRDDLERIFEPFIQLEPVQTRHFGGLGLGLPIARRLARLHGGDVTLESRPGSGTIARFILPARRVRIMAGPEQRAVA